MVGPSRTADERDVDRRRLAIGFVCLVGASGGLIAVQGGASLLLIATGVLVGLLAGAALLWYLAWITG